MPPSGCAAGRRILGTDGKSCRRKRLRGGTRRLTGARRLLLLLQAGCEREECYRMEFVMSPASGTTRLVNWTPTRRRTGFLRATVRNSFSLFGLVEACALHNMRTRCRIAPE